MANRVIEIGGHTNNPIGKRLSNFAERSFVFDGVPCGGLEGFIQSLKCPDVERQREICKLSGKAAKEAGRAYDFWKTRQLLFWNGDTYKRTSRGYVLLIARVYDELYNQDETFRDELLALGDAQIWHSIGKPDMRETTLTEVEMLCQIERLRHRALRDALTVQVQSFTKVLR